jgi:hypothetical protein
VGLETISADEVAVLVEVVTEGGMDGAEFLQGLGLPPLGDPVSMLVHGGF